MKQNKNTVCLNDENYFEFSNGLWTGKKQPLLKVNVIRNTNFTTFGKIDTTDIASIDVDNKQFESKKLIEGDIVIERSGGGPKQPVGRVVYFDLDENENYSFSNFTSSIRSKDKSKIKPRYLFYALLNFYFNGDIQRYQAQTTGLRNLDFNKYKDAVSFSLLDISDQNKIIHTLDLIQSAIEKQEQIISKTTELKIALTHKLFTEGAKGEKQKETEIGLVPKSWMVVEFEEVCDLISKTYEPQPNGNKKYIGLEHIIPSVPTLKKYGLENEVISSKNQFKAGQIIYGKLRPYLDKAAIPHFDGICSSDILVIDGKNNVHNEFLIQLIHFDKFIQYAKSTTTGVQHPRTSWSSLKKFKFGLPGEPERNLISTNLSACDNKIEFHQTKKETLSKLFRTMLYKLMTGEVSVEGFNLQKEYSFEEENLSMAAEP